MLEKELNYINNPKIKESATYLVSLLPEYIYHIAASSTAKYHPSFTLGDGGLIRHIKVAVRIAKELLDNPIFGDAFDNDEKDLIILALILHDGLKKGMIEDKYTKFEHPLLISNLIKENINNMSLNSEEITLLCSMIESHMGPWNTNEYSDVSLLCPKSRYERFVHMCDYLASRRFLDVKFEGNEIE